ncbi:hypothetical protein [Pseudonocardia nigra]|uniref:hypothetical protein n=1 Tax=Pseudonocardia nigra TaxID=1921578 RepID=UPI001C5CDF19|nr:hypothetical protein [Pseudonocardia nigra]
MHTHSTGAITKAMEPVSTALYELESEVDRAREDAARPGPPYRIAAQKLTAWVGLHLGEQQDSIFNHFISGAGASPAGLARGHLRPADRRDAWCGRAWRGSG